MEGAAQEIKYRFALEVPTSLPTPPPPTTKEPWPKKEWVESTNSQVLGNSEKAYPGFWNASSFCIKVYVYEVHCIQVYVKEEVTIK